MNEKDWRWLKDLIYTSKMCLNGKKPSCDYNKLMCQLEYKLEEKGGV